MECLLASNPNMMDEGHWDKCQHRVPHDKAAITQSLWWENDKGQPPKSRLARDQSGPKERDHLA